MELAGMAFQPNLLRPLPSCTLSNLSPTSCSSTCIFPRSIWFSVPDLVAREVQRTCGSRSVDCVRPVGSEIAGHSQVEEGPNLPCDTCHGKGWLLCEFCQGQKTNVQVRANKFYRRCPSCRAVGVVICPQCKVFKCVMFPDVTDGSLDK